MAGSLGLRIDRAEATAELGYRVDAEYEGRGLVRRAAELLIEHGFGPLGLRRIGLRTVVDNVRSRAPPSGSASPRSRCCRRARCSPTGRATWRSTACRAMPGRRAAPDPGAAGPGAARRGVRPRGPSSPGRATGWS